MGPGTPPQEWGTTVQQPEQAGAPGGNAAAFDPSRDNVFARIAHRYDRLCDIFSLRRLGAGNGAGRTIWVTDLCPEMLALARGKLAGRGPVKIAIANVHALAEFPAGSVDLFSISFGMKICDRKQVLAEAFRVLKPGGTFFCLEAARIPLAPLHALYLAYIRWCLPVIAKIATGGDASAYDYLVRGIHEFPAQREFCAEMEGYGFREVGYRNMTFGIVALHTGRKPAAPQPS